MSLCFIVDKSTAHNDSTIQEVVGCWRKEKKERVGVGGRKPSQDGESRHARFLWPRHCCHEPHSLLTFDFLLSSHLAQRLNWSFWKEHHKEYYIADLTCEGHKQRLLHVLWVKVQEGTDMSAVINLSLTYICPLWNEHRLLFFPLHSSPFLNSSDEAEGSCLKDKGWGSHLEAE